MKAFGTCDGRAVRLQVPGARAAEAVTTLMLGYGCRPAAERFKALA